MKCPFLKDASVKYCEASAYRKMLLKDAISAQSERCSTSAWRACPAARLRDSDPSHERCPFLHEAQAEYCGAASVTKFIPATNDLLSRCNSDGHLYCELFLVHADPVGERRPHHRSGLPADDPSAAGVPMPHDLRFSPNHMWLDVSDDGSCHIGIDAFAAKVLGPVERVTFVPQRSGSCPTAVLHVNGVDVSMVFPEPHAVSANVYLRTSPAKLTEDPYGAGWLFECSERPAAAPGVDANATGAKLLSGSEAVAWMQDEMRRLNEFVQERIACHDVGGIRSMADGGTVEDGLAAHLDRDDLIALASDFFTAQADWRRFS